MAEPVLWEYRVLSVGNAFTGAKDELIEATLNEWGEEGWEVFSVFTPESSSKVKIVAKRPLTDAVRRRRSMPGIREPK